MYPPNLCLLEKGTSIISVKIAKIMSMRQGMDYSLLITMDWGIWFNNSSWLRLIAIHFIKDSVPSIYREWRNGVSETEREKHWRK